MGFSVTVGPHCSTAEEEVVVDNTQKRILIVFVVLFLIVFVSSSIELVDRLIRDNCIKTMTDEGFDEKDEDTNNNKSELSTTDRSYSRQTSAISTTSTVITSRSNFFQFMTTFSVIRNTRTLFMNSPTAARMPAIDSLRLIFILFYFILNSYLFTIAFAPMVLSRFYALGPMQILSEKKYLFIRLYYIFDIFLLLSGIAFMVSFRKSESKLKHTSISSTFLSYAFQTYLRYLLPVLFSVALILVFPLFGSGPLWDLFGETISSSCTINAQQTLFMYSNFVEKLETVCNLPSSFISMAFQVKLLGVLLVLATTRYLHLRPLRATLFYLTVFILLCGGQLLARYGPFYNIKFFYEYRSMASLGELRRSLSYYALHPTFHLSSLVYGYFFGTLITFYPGKRLINSLYVGIVLFAIHIGCVIFVEKIDIFDPQLTTPYIATLVSFGRAGILSFYGWLIYACSSGRITVVNRFLSSTVWRPLSKLSLGFYLCSTIASMVRLFSIRKTITLSADNMFRAIVSDTVIAFLFAYVAYVGLQQPVANLMEMVSGEQNDDNTLDDSKCANSTDIYDKKSFICKNNNNHLHVISLKELPKVTFSSKNEHEES